MVIHVKLYDVFMHCFLDHYLDHMSVYVGLVFTPGTTNIQCHPINITNDTILEDDEVFDVALSTMDDDVILSPNITSITILDDDSKYILLYKLIICSNYSKQHV